MNHIPFDTLNLYLDDQLDPNTRADVERHLVGCEECRRELAALRTLFLEFEQLPPEPLPLDLAPAVMAQIAPQPQRSPLGWLVLAAQLLLTVVLAVWLVPLIAGGVWFGVTPPSINLFFASIVRLASWLNDQLAALPVIGADLVQATRAIEIGPLASVTPLQWFLIIAGCGVAWLVGNRFLLAGLPVLHTQQEAR